ncbi:MAG TPA: transketolase C-terminal domain-containing protein, partial [Patescibacteria group bacterium]
MRTAFLQSLTTLMEQDKNIVTITADMGFSVFEEMQQKFPTRFINTGVTEQSSASIAAGLALSGMKVFFYAQAPFITMRCFEQVRLDIAYNNLDVTIVGASSGFYSNQLGVSHFALEDIALMRLLPNMSVFAPGDSVEMQGVMKYVYKRKSPSYIRVTKAGSPVVYAKPVSSVSTAIELFSGDEATVFVTGSLLPVAKKVAENLQKKNITISLFSVPQIKPLDEKTILREAKKMKKIITIEDHYITGGLGSAVSEVIAASNAQ